MSKQRAIICDLDGTLANIDHRRHFVEGVEKKDWKSFFAGIPYDEINLTVSKFLVTSRIQGTKVILMTGRGEETMPDTLAWLDKWRVSFDAIFHRKAGDFRADHIIKKELYDEFVVSRFEVDLVLDDRNSVVKMWREMGLQCWQVADGNF